MKDISVCNILSSVIVRLHYVFGNFVFEIYEVNIFQYSFSFKLWEVFKMLKLKKTSELKERI